MDMCRYHGGICRNREKYIDCPDGFYVKGLCHQKCHKTQCCISSKYNYIMLGFNIVLIIAENYVISWSSFLIYTNIFLFNFKFV